MFEITSLHPLNTVYSTYNNVIILMLRCFFGKTFFVYSSKKCYRAYPERLA